MGRGHVWPDGTTVAALRGEAGLTQHDLARRAGYGLRTIGNIERSQPTTAPTLQAIATVFSENLGRTVALADLLDARRMMSRSVSPTQSAVTVSEHVQWLDFISAPSGAADAADAGCPRMVLTESCCIRPGTLPPASIDFCYFAAGRAIGRSLSHPDGACWSEGVGQCSKLRVELNEVRGERSFMVQNRVEFLAEPTAGAWFQTLLLYPTDCLTIVARFPESWSAEDLRGLCRRRIAGALLPARHEPLWVCENRVALWRIASPIPGETYQLRWTWRSLLNQPADAASARFQPT